MLALGAGIVLAVVLVATLEAHGSAHGSHASQTPTPPRHGGIHKIRHVVVIMQENRSYDSYFGTYPGADGIPGLAGQSGQGSVPARYSTRRSASGRTTTRPTRNYGRPAQRRRPGFTTSRAGRWTAFKSRRRHSEATVAQPPTTQTARLLCPSSKPDVMGYHDWREIPNYWAYARHFVLQDHMFESVNSWSLPAHLALVSGWSAQCSKAHDPMSCKTERRAGRLSAPRRSQETRTSRGRTSRTSFTATG